ncbi:MAG: hypothetical protein Q8S02_00855 [Hydrogenophaga sp.]|nr:hypothetical protein [Hydrogenophaga sp.]
MSDVEYRHFLSKARAAKEGGHAAWSVQSTGEKVAVALALNHADWLASMNYTMAEAIERTGPVWISLLPRVVRALDSDA